MFSWWTGIQSTTAPKVSLGKSLFFQANWFYGPGCADEIADRLCELSLWLAGCFWALALKKKQKLPSVRWHLWGEGLSGLWWAACAHQEGWTLPWGGLRAVQPQKASPLAQG